MSVVAAAVHIPLQVFAHPHLVTSCLHLTAFLDRESLISSPSLFNATYLRPYLFMYEGNGVIH